MLQNFNFEYLWNDPHPCSKYYEWMYKGFEYFEKKYPLKGVFMKDQAYDETQRITVITDSITRI